MASIDGLCWSTAEDLFSDLELDELYIRQVQAMEPGTSSDYPYLVLVYTGKITIAITLEQSGRLSAVSRRRNLRSDGEAPQTSLRREEPSR